MEPLALLFADTAPLLSLNFFFHGESRLGEKSPLSQAEWKELVQAIIQKHQIPKFRIVAYSMGCKFALLTAQLRPNFVSQLSLLAPDGLVMNPWYRFATQSSFGRLLLKISTNWVTFIRFLAISFGKIGLVRPSIGRFAMGEMSTPEKRQRVLEVWIRFRYMWPDWEVLPSVLKENGIRIRIVLGRFDGVIPPKKFMPRQPAWNAFDWVMVQAGHGNLVAEVSKHPEILNA